VLATVDRLRAGPLEGLRIEPMHGRMNAADREAVMSRFRAGEVDVLVATTVIEVGVDVANATVMVIDHAERFGLSQLHQLRGRVGRGRLGGVCVLMGEPTTEEARSRLETMCATSDGFELAERDLELRGPGEVFGSRQSGQLPFRAAELPRDVELLLLARRDAVGIVGADPELSSPERRLLRARLRKRIAPSLGLADVA
jgi:ATP-dependent DNA helicase RecG